MPNAFVGFCYLDVPLVVTAGPWVAFEVLPNLCDGDVTSAASLATSPGTSPASSFLLLLLSLQAHSCCRAFAHPGILPGLCPPQVFSPSVCHSSGASAPLFLV